MLNVDKNEIINVEQPQLSAGLSPSYTFCCDINLKRNFTESTSGRRLNSQEEGTFILNLFLNSIYYRHHAYFRNMIYDI